MWLTFWSHPVITWPTTSRCVRKYTVNYRHSRARGQMTLSHWRAQWEWMRTLRVWRRLLSEWDADQPAPQSHPDISATAVNSALRQGLQLTLTWHFSPNCQIALNHQTTCCSYHVTTTSEVPHLWKPKELNCAFRTPLTFPERHVFLKLNLGFQFGAR